MPITVIAGKTLNIGTMWLTPQTQAETLKIVTLSVEPSPLYIQDYVTITGSIYYSGPREYDYVEAYISIDSQQWQLMATRVYRDTTQTATIPYIPGTITFFDPGTYQITCTAIGKFSGLTDQKTISVTVLPRELTNAFVLDPEITHLYDYSRNPGGWFELNAFPPEADPQLLSIPVAEYKGEDLHVEITYTLKPNLVSHWPDEDGWYWYLWLFSEGKDYTYPYIPNVPYGHRSGDPPDYAFAFEENLTTASLRRLWTPDSPRNFNVIIGTSYRGSISGYEDLERKWKVGRILLPPL